MNHDQHMLDEQERQMLEHFRQHSSGEPSAQLDAQILAAASAAVRSAATTEAKPGLSTRLHSWLFGAGGRQRWSVALAGVACLGIGVSLTWRTFEQTPDAFDAVPSAAPLAPAAARMAPLAESAILADEAQRSRAVPSTAMTQGDRLDAAKAEKKLSESVANQHLAEEPTADALREPLPQATGSAAQRAASKPVEVAENLAQKQLRTELQQLLKLRRDGWTDEADALFLRLMREYPELDIDAQLQQLQQPD
jgi:hypothetical protein